jgi:uncharacterized protein (DUF697 family)
MKIGGLMGKPAVATAQVALGAVREVREDVSARRPVYVCGRTDPAQRVLDALRAGGGDPDAAQAFALRRLRDDDARALRKAVVVVYAGEVSETLDADTRSDLDAAGGSRRPLVALLEGIDVPGAALIEAARTRGLPPDAVIPAKRGTSFPADELLRAVAEQAGSAGPQLAARLPALRQHVVERLIAVASRRNGVVAATVFVPGADMAVLTAVELRLVLQIAACHGQELSADRLLELAGVFGAGLGLRTVARELLDVVPVAGWVVKGAVAYSGTRAIGRAAAEYFEHGAAADVSRVRSLVASFRGA